MRDEPTPPGLEVRVPSLSFALLCFFGVYCKLLRFSLAKRRGCTAKHDKDNISNSSGSGGRTTS